MRRRFRCSCASCNRERRDLSMRKVNVKDVPEVERKSPRGKFHKFARNISVALGREPASLDLSKRHPFDLALVRIPKGKTYCPYHLHAAESELYLVVSGRGSVRDGGGSTIVTAGDAFLFQPGEAHQLANAGDDDFVYYVIADNPRCGGPGGDSCYYPDSGKWAVAKEGLEDIIVKGAETDYFEGEE
jgi:uncharacterized cupin superfamily protein